MAEKSGRATAGSEYPVALVEFIETVLIQDLEKMVYSCKLHYLSFGLIGQGIEFLGACLDEVPFDKKNESQKRFKKAVQRLLTRANNAYAKNKPPRSAHFLYDGLRSGLTHTLRPKCGICLTSREEARADGTRHLVEDPDGKLILVVEDLYDDFNSACKGVIRMLQTKKLTNPKLYQPFISVRGYGQSETKGG